MVLYVQFAVSVGFCDVGIKYVCRNKLGGGGGGVGWCDGAGKLAVPGRPTILITVGQGPSAFAVGAGGGGLDIFTLIYPFSSFSLSLGDGPI